MLGQIQSIAAAVVALCIYLKISLCSPGMLPHKTKRGQAALERLKVFDGIPPPYDKVMISVNNQGPHHIHNSAVCDVTHNTLPTLFEQ